MDEAYEGKYTCADGHIVKSKSEREIDNYLFYRNIPHAYEKAVSLDGTRDNIIYPAFYLPQQDLYIEHWGFDESNKKYQQSKIYKIEKYKELGLTIICTNEKEDAPDINAALDRKLQHYKKDEINFL